MTALTASIHTGRLNGQPVRFFKGPSGGPELPWHAVEDIYRALGLPRAVRTQLLRMTQETWGQDLRTVATPEGLVTIAPHCVAQGLLGAATKLMGLRAKVGADLLSEYAQAGGEVLKKLTGDLRPLASVAFALEAQRNTSRIGETR
jgi:hypothetical protein